ncbi:MAG: class I SAM-dependent methyltransferase [Cyanothece sp. SIO1E1]|nr:class I SAM-dependent methyltransferase [Cyanothece sp. SIO1E1]
MKKIQEDFVIAQYQSGIENYAAFTREVGLWASENYVFQKYLKTTDRILDLGCGTGRTTFSLFDLGYTDILGVDLTPEMIVAANLIKAERNSTLSFEVGNAKALNFEAAAFDAVIFSFNGLMSIPGRAARVKALLEIHRVLKGGGLFIFTTHDREQDENYFAFWQEEKERWEKGAQKTELYEFGDIIATSKNEERPIFIHIPNQKEIQDFLMQGGFSILETFYRNEKFEESAQVKEKSGECRFWIAQKKA